ncbi:hypothetical protein CXG81DRAFT_21526 [Caulochytrium protostelioides]|uniref:Uncharacterized protein n=1 Tax=Caulochytrium protostelioides TaxID=1555241 RepID=A0A4P9WUN9_9FUNG|nr:hypothetical protein CAUPRSCDRAFT_12112 [Caulochytrium protostelioides]RKO98225.1 hypothetical protein CXG81DRAFT_21526 [Caulochytrium protostelioides]|eukprot:RKO98225.1 hypothetical protein CXG81DRAFT_21526 [Caulochytrium protostelioides]
MADAADVGRSYPTQHPCQPPKRVVWLPMGCRVPPQPACGGFPRLLQPSGRVIHHAATQMALLCRRRPQRTSIQRYLQLWPEAPYRCPRTGYMATTRAWPHMAGMMQKLLRAHLVLFHDTTVLHRMGLMPDIDGRCPICREARDTRAHLVLGCPGLSRERAASGIPTLTQSDAAGHIGGDDGRPPAAGGQRGSGVGPRADGSTRPRPHPPSHTAGISEGSIETGEAPTTTDAAHGVIPGAHDNAAHPTQTTLPRHPTDGQRPMLLAAAFIHQANAKRHGCIDRLRREHHMPWRGRGRPTGATTDLD